LLLAVGNNGVYRETAGVLAFRHQLPSRSRSARTAHSKVAAIYARH
jgi:hypothetical protein